MRMDARERLAEMSKVEPALYESILDSGMAYHFNQIGVDLIDADAELARLRAENERLTRYYDEARVQLAERRDTAERLTREREDAVLRGDRWFAKGGAAEVLADEYKSRLTAAEQARDALAERVGKLEGGLQWMRREVHDAQQRWAEPRHVDTLDARHTAAALRIRVDALLAPAGDDAEVRDA